MTHLRIYDEADGATVLVDTRDRDEIAAKLNEIGVACAHWGLRDLAADADPLAVYAPEIEALRGANGYQAVDVIRLAPDHPDRAALRAKFLSEHRHSEDEVRFFVEGEGLFTLHEGGRVYAVLCEAGDLISVPAGMRHWFDMGPAPRFTAIRLFTNPEGWVAQFTGDAIADNFPRHEPVVA
ncbi:MAG: 1,2-dihydroxy-3-keto-5-methylthiopentene dioxygenase [Pseudomonadota bacterium]